ncbi:MAG: transketolase [Nitrospiraceae bacterium]|nr:MAG: transketolase [Nitrospiraceae bacterium]
MTKNEQMDQLCINTIRTLSMDAVQQANSGHPGTPMAMAPVAYCLWQRFLRYDPEHPLWPNRDRFVLSMGHASMLLYSILHLCGVKDADKHGNISNRLSIEIEDIKNFRQLGSRTPGHPEYGIAAGIETTTGPLGQGAANSVGMAIAGKWKAGYFNRTDLDLFNYDVYALCSDGDMMEGVSSEAASLAGHLRLSNLCWIYDDNNITIEGSTSLAFSEDIAFRFKGYGWRVIRVKDANDLRMLARAFRQFRNTHDRPTLIIVSSHIAFGSPNRQDTAGAHGEPLGEDEIRLTKRNYGWPEDAKFFVPDGVMAHFRKGLGRRGKKLHKSWGRKLDEFRDKFHREAGLLDSMLNSRLPDGWDSELPVFPPDVKGIASRVSSGKVLNAVAKYVPWLMGGSADLAPSTKTLLTFEDAGGDFSTANPKGRNFHFGIREHAMGSILNGLALSRIRPYGATFLIFSDYARPAMRLSALMEVPTIYIYTHDSISVGEDGPTHQPIEHIASLRAMPGLITIRPADANEVVEAWRVIMQLRHEPVALMLTRQNIPTLDRSRYAPASGLAKGAYILADAEDGKPDLLLIASGSEVSLCIDASEQLKSEGIKVRVVSMPSWELFEKQSQEYRDSVILPTVSARIAVEQGATLGWERYVGDNGQIIGMHTFGASAPFKDLQKKFGFTSDKVVAAAKVLVKI